MTTQLATSTSLNSDHDSNSMLGFLTGEENRAFEISESVTPIWQTFSTEIISMANQQISTLYYRISLLGDLTPDAELDRIWDGGMRDRNSVEGIVKNRPFLLEVLKEAYTEIRSRFNSESVILESIDWLEDQPEEGKLIIAIQTKLSVDEARAALKDFDTNWWLPNIRKAEGYLSILLEYI